jgi:signal transduction histidine kinase
MGKKALSPGSTRRWGSIRAHLASLVIIQLVLLVVLFGYSSMQDYRKAWRDAANDTKATAELAADLLDTEAVSFREQFAQLESLGDVFRSPGVCDLLLDAESDPTDWFTSDTVLLRRDGSARCPVGETLDIEELAGSDWFPEALDAPVERVSLSVDEDDHGEWIFAAGIPGADVVLVDVIHMESIAPYLGRKFATPSYKPEFTIRSGAELLSDGVSGGERTTRAATAEELDWTVAASLSDAQALAHANRALRDRIVFSTFVIALSLAVAVVISRRFARPVRSLARATRAITAGERSVHVQPTGPTELVELGQSFNHMLDVRNEAESALRKAYEAEQKAADELREVDGMRQSFLMAISHELRTPLTSVVGYAQFLDDMRGQVSLEEMEEGVEAISSQAKRLERLLLDLLDVERLSRGVVQPKLVTCDVRQMMLRVVEEFDSQARITIKTKGAARATVDPALVERIFENLIVNSIKHTPAGTRIWVGAVRRNGELMITVEDEGQGVPDELKGAIFEPFKQGTEVHKGSPGTGVGLSLVSQFAKLHGGRAWVEDRKGGGAAFFVVLPAVVKKAERKRTAKRAKGHELQAAAEKVPSDEAAA